MAGGSGKRLWPLSRQGMPKQMLHLVGDTSLLRLAYERVVDVVGADYVWVCTGARYADAVRAELPELAPERILGEPEGRDSLNAVAWPAAVLAQQDPEAVVAMVTADQLMEPTSAFQDALREAFTVAEADPTALVTFGVVPNSPHTGYGYLRRGAPLTEHPNVCRVAEFVEKPNLETAQRYLDSQNYWWNAGMFVWQARTLLAQLEHLVPDCFRIVTEIAADPGKVEQMFGGLPKISVDYAIMEPVSRGRGAVIEGVRSHVVAVRLPIRWFDVGGFPSLAEHLPHDDAGNALDGRTMILDAGHNLVLNKASEHLVAVMGVHDLVVVATDDITMVCPVSQAESIKALVAKVADEVGPEFA